MSCDARVPKHTKVAARGAWAHPALPFGFVQRRRLHQAAIWGFLVRQRAGARLGSCSGSLLFHATGRPYQADQPSVNGDQPTDGASCLLIAVLIAVQSTARRCSSPLQLASAAGSRWALPRRRSSGWWPSAVRRRGGLYLALPAALETAERRAQETCPENLRRAPRRPRGLSRTHPRGCFTSSQRPPPAAVHRQCRAALGGGGAEDWVGGRSQRRSTAGGGAYVCEIVLLDGS